jgi:hypothetical protein
MAKNLAESLNNVLLIIDREYTDAGGDIHITPKHLEKFEVETSYLQERLGITPFQSIIFAVIIQCNSTNRCTINSIAKNLGMTYLQFLSYANELYALRDNWLIRIRGNNEIKVPSEVIECLMKDTPIEKPRIDGLNTLAIFRRVGGYMKATADDQMPSSQVVEETEALIDANPQTSYAQACKKYLTDNNISAQERLMFYVMSYLYLRRGISVFDMADIDDYIQDENWNMEIKDFFDVEALDLQRKGIIEPARTDGLFERGSFSFKEEVSKEMFSDIKLYSTNARTVDLNDLKGKPVKQLFYNKEEKGQIERLGSLLEEDSLQKVFSSMKEKGLRTGMICLFYGDPGTGKTETVYQMARRTGRKILEADVAKLRNCYVGETEKNMRALFADYRTACEENKLKPILLFNEADAILGKRMEGAVKAVDRMENSVQNILLQEMETFEGIMIATTNLLGNLDPAFERRFLFKIRFNKPTLKLTPLKLPIIKLPFPSFNPLLFLLLLHPNLSFNLLPLIHPLNLQLLTILLILTFFLYLPFQHIQSNTLFQFIGFNGYGPSEAILLVEILN